MSENETKQEAQETTGKRRGRDKAESRQGPACKIEVTPHSTTVIGHLLAAVAQRQAEVHQQEEAERLRLTELLTDADER